MEAIESESQELEYGPYMPYAKCPCGRLFRDWTEFVGYWPIWENALCDVCVNCGEPGSKRTRLSARVIYRLIPRSGLAGRLGLKPTRTAVGMDEKVFDADNLEIAMEVADG